MDNTKHQFWVYIDEVYVEDNWHFVYVGLGNHKRTCNFNRNDKYNNIRDKYGPIKRTAIKCRSKKEMINLEDKLMMCCGTYVDSKSFNEQFGCNLDRGVPHYTHGKLTKVKLSKLNTGKNNPMFGRKHSEETRKKMSDAGKLAYMEGRNKGWQKANEQPRSAEWSNNIAHGKRGRKLSEEHKRKIGEASKKMWEKRRSIA
jgi:hypothetical protein